MTQGVDFVLYFVLLCGFPERIYSINYPTVFWTTCNCRFNMNKPNGEDEPELYSFRVKPFNNNVFFTCPHVAIWRDLSTKSADLGLMYENLLMVDEEGYRTCSVGNRSSKYHNKEMLRCDDPQKITHFQERFTDIRADMNRIEYEYGRSYYFISTSSGTLESLNNTEGGHCKTHNMKLRIYVCNKTEPCEFELPKCPFTNVFGDVPKRPTSPSGGGPALVKKNGTTVTARPLTGGSSYHLSESTHMILHGVSAFILLILVATLVRVGCINRNNMVFRKNTKAITKCELAKQSAIV